MNDSVDSHTVTLIRQLYQEDDAARAFFDTAAGRTNDVAQTSVERLAYMAGGIARYEAISLARQLMEMGCGDFLVGRKGRKSRVRWRFSLKSLGKAAQGHEQALEEVDPEILADAADQDAPSAMPEVVDEPPRNPAEETMLTISAAKEALARTFDVKPEQIDIIIRA